MNTDEQLLLDQTPDIISVDMMMKASASEENGERFIYFEASNEDVDHQNEVVLQKALAASADYYLRHGNIDISHYTILGPRSGIPNFLEYEIGKPVDVRLDKKKTFVKAQLYRGDSAMAKNANMVWDSLVNQSPAASWYASVGGSVIAKSVKINPETNEKVAVVEAVRWNNTALDRCPVNRSVGRISTVPTAVFAKSLNGFVMSKSLTADYGTDSAALTGGSALRIQSVGGTPASYYDFRDRLAGAIKSREAKLQTPEGLVEYSKSKFSLSADEATEWVGRFLGDLKSKLKLGA